jgi:hypothetical protein
VADEISSILGKLRFNDGSEASLQYSLQIDPKKKKISEFIFDESDKYWFRLYLALVAIEID